MGDKLAGMCAPAREPPPEGEHQRQTELGSWCVASRCPASPPSSSEASQAFRLCSARSPDTLPVAEVTRWAGFPSFLLFKGQPLLQNCSSQAGGEAAS